MIELQCERCVGLGFLGGSECATCGGTGIITDDPVNRPSHYTQGGIETIDYLRAKLSPPEFAGYCRGNVLKYMSRGPHKGGIEDYRKAQVYLEWLIDAQAGIDVMVQAQIEYMGGGDDECQQ